MNDLRAGFVSPPKGFGEVAFYWWVGGKLDRERIRWQLDQLAGAKISGLQVNYAHGPTGGISWGLSYPSDPPLFSEEWWELFAWFKGEANARGMAVSLSDYTLGIGQGWFCDEIVRDPALRGSVLEAVVLEADSDTSATWTQDTLAAYAVRGGGHEPAVLRRLRPFSGGVASLPEETVVLVRAVTRPYSLDPMNPEVGRRYIAGFFQKFEDRFPGEGGLNYFFSDELDLGVAGCLWTARFVEEFLRRKGYDLMDELPALFIDIGPRTPKVRLDYRDVMVALEEEAFFKPIYDWHESRGMTYGCDHGWRGHKTTEFGDYFRTQRWNQGPGCDQPRLEADVVRNKVASSIAHLNQRPRTWLEGFYSSGWGTTSAQVVDAVFRNFAMGHNLLTLHGLYYSTHGGWWEWAPPCNHFRMPYWPHFKRFLECSERLSFLLSRGVHACDVAILYPVAASEGGAGGALASKSAFQLADALYRSGIDLDFIDFESLHAAEARDGGLHIAGESYRVLVIPPMPVIRFSSLEAAERMVAAGGWVVFLGDVPVASDRAGRLDPVLDERCTALSASPQVRRFDSPEAALIFLAQENPDFRLLEGGGTPYVQHRIIEGRHLFFLYGLEAGALVELRATGWVTRWNPWDGTESVVPVESATCDRTRLRLSDGAATPYLIWFAEEDEEAPATRPPTPARHTVEGPWTCEPVPCLDNRWGDFRLPAFEGFIGPEIRAVEVAGPEGEWRSHACGTGPVYECFEAAESDQLRQRLLSGVGDLGKPLEASWRWGLPEDAGFQGWHGLKGRVHDDLFSFGERDAVRFLRALVHVESDTTAIWNLGGTAQPVAGWVDRRPVDLATPLALGSGTHEVLLEYSGAGRGYAVLASERIEPVAAEPAWFGPLHTRWFNDARVLPMGLSKSTETLRLRFRIPAGTRSLTFGLLGDLLESRIDGVVLPAERVSRDPAFFPSEETDVWVLYLPSTTAHAEVLLQVRPLAGLSGAQVVPDAIQLKVESFPASLGDWAELPGFECYSGGMRYTKEVDLPPEHTSGVLDLGDLSSTAEVWVNGESAGVLCAPPWRLDISTHLRCGRNRFEIEVRSALSNHYKTIPTDYRGEERCGLFGPVRLETNGKQVRESP